MNKRILPVIIFFVFVEIILITLKGQEYPIYNQYYFNYYLVNPALAGVNDCSYFMLTHEQQWVGMQDAPHTSSFSFQTRLKNNFGVGTYIFNDKNGYSTQQGAQLTVAYHIPLTPGERYTRSIHRDRQLSLAVSAKFFNYGFDSELYRVVTGSDPAMQDLSSVTAFNANVGSYYTSYGFFTGLSFTNLARIKMPSSDVDIEPILPLTGFYLLGNEFTVGKDQALEPSLMYMFDTKQNMAMDLNLRYSRDIAKEKYSYWVQLTFRQNLDKGNYQALTLKPMVGFQFNKVHLAYAYGVDLNKLVRFNYGTHELMLGYTLCYTEKFCR